MKRILIAALVAGSLAGCATTKQDPLMQCVAAINAKTSYDPLRSKMSLVGADEQTVAMLASTERPSEAEKPLILSWANDRQACLRQDEANRKDMHPAARNLFAMSSSMTTTAISQLYGGQLTYGEFAQRRQQITDALRKDLSAMESTAMAQDAANKRQVLLMQLQNQLSKPTGNPPMPAPYMMPSPAPASTTTSCTTFGNQVNCVSR